MGKPKEKQVIFMIKNAQPREVYFQAINLQRKVATLRYKLTSRLPQEQEITPDNILPTDVWDRINSSLSLLRDAKQEMKLSPIETVAKPVSGKTPTDVYMAIVKANRQLDVLMTAPLTPSNVYMEVTRSLDYVLALQAGFTAKRIGPFPEFVSNKTPSDVYALMNEIYDMVTAIIKMSGENTLDLEVKENVLVEPKDVYTLLLMIEAQLQFLYSRSNSEQILYDPVYPGVKFPSHVFQRGLLLKRHIGYLQQSVKENPNWIKPE
jgi:hypothetical protein